MSNCRLTPGQVADIIERFLSNTPLPAQESGDFTDCALPDPKLDDYRRRCEVLFAVWEPRPGSRHLVLLDLNEPQRQVEREASAIEELRQIVEELRLLEIGSR
jgi:hypothetical protein